MYKKSLSLSLSSTPFFLLFFLYSSSSSISPSPHHIIINLQPHPLHLPARHIHNLILQIAIELGTPEELLKDHVNILPRIISELIETQQVNDILHQPKRVDHLDAGLHHLLHAGDRLLV